MEPDRFAAVALIERRIIHVGLIIHFDDRHGGFLKGGTPKSSMENLWIFQYKWFFHPFFGVPHVWYPHDCRPWLSIETRGDLGIPHFEKPPNWKSAIGGFLMFHPQKTMTKPGPFEVDRIYTEHHRTLWGKRHFSFLLLRWDGWNGRLRRIRSNGVLRREKLCLAGASQRSLCANWPSWSPGYECCQMSDVHQELCQCGCFEKFWSFFGFTY